LNHDLRRRELGENVELGLAGGVKAGCQEQCRQDENDRAVVDRPVNDGLEHNSESVFPTVLPLAA
jgi:hypothetical protein